MISQKRRASGFDGGSKFESITAFGKGQPSEELKFSNKVHNCSIILSRGLQQTSSDKRE
jgi:hypothetical protein